MRRLGRALLRAPWARRTAALTLTVGLFAGNSVMVSSTVLAATPGQSGGLLQLGSLGLGGGDGSTSTGLLSTLTQTVTQTVDEQLSSLGQQVCAAVQVTCPTGTQGFVIPSGVLTLGMPRPHPHSVPPATGSARTAPRLPSTGCILGIIGNSCGSTPTPTPKASAATVSPSASATTSTTTSSTTTKTTTSSSTSSSSGSSGSCVLGLLGTCSSSGGGLLSGVGNTLGNTVSGLGSTVSGLVGGTSNSTATPSPAPGSSGLCVLSSSLLCLGGSNCTASLAGSCLVPTSNAASGSSSSSGGGGGACVVTICLLGSSCTLSAGSSCIVGALLPGLPGLLGSPSGGSSSPGSSTSGGTPGAGGGTGGGGGAGSTSSGPVGGLPLLGIAASSPTQPSGSQGSTLPLTQTPSGDAIVGLVNGITFGHGLILWPLFGLLDLAALAGLVVVVRRRWSATPG